MPIIRTIHNKDNPYFLLNRAAVEDERLSFKAVGIHTYLMSKPDHWSIHEADLAARHKEGTTAVRSGLKELHAAGYMITVKLRDETTGRMAGSELHVYEISQIADGEYRDVENPHVGKTHMSDNPQVGQSAGRETNDIVINDLVVSNDGLENNDPLVSNDLPTYGDQPEPENEPEPQPQAGRPPKPISLLIDPSVGLHPTAAKKLNHLDPEFVARHIFKWFRDRERSTGVGCGVLPARLRDASFVAPPLTDDDRRHPYYVRHFGPYDFDAADAKDRNEYAAWSEA